MKKKKALGKHQKVRECLTRIKRVVKEICRFLLFGNYWFQGKSDYKKLNNEELKSKYDEIEF